LHSTSSRKRLLKSLLLTPSTLMRPAPSAEPVKPPADLKRFGLYESHCLFWQNAEEPVSGQDKEPLSAHSQVAVQPHIQQRMLNNRAATLTCHNIDACVRSLACRGRVSLHAFCLECCILFSTF
jgi:hypothetical protein